VHNVTYAVALLNVAMDNCRKITEATATSPAASAAGESGRDAQPTTRGSG